MSSRSLIITSPSSLHIKHANLVVTNLACNEKVIFPLNDMAMVVLDNREISLTHSVMAACSSNKIAIVTTDSYHMPCGIFLPFYQYFKSSHVLKLQVKASQKLQDKLWQNLIKNKLYNQSQTLKFFNKDDYKSLLNLSTKVKGGDKENIEAIAARIYFISLFNKDFNRQDNSLPNIFLNYGYSIVRSTIAKAVAAKGFNCSLGIHHASVLNSFNLVDDLIEPFRAIIDYYVKIYILKHNENITNFSTSEKTFLVNLLHKTVQINNETVTLTSAIEKLVSSLLQCYENKSAEHLVEINFTTPTKDKNND